MQKLKTFLRRLSKMSFKRMKMYAEKAAARSGRPALLIMLDMVWCSFVYGVGYLDYLTFGFVWQSAKKRRSFMTMNDNLSLVRRLNPAEKREVFEDKALFARRFADFMGRGFTDLRESGERGFRAFCQKHPVVFAKETHGFGGHGVLRLRSEKIEDFSALYKELCAKEMFLIEQEAAQHIDMNRLNQSSVNTVRIVTLEKDGEVYIMYALIRMGSGEGYVDNISSGGMYAPLDSEGKISAEAFCDRTGEYYSEHPATHTALIGFQVPYFKEALELVKRAAKLAEGVRYIGWDVAVCKDGPVFIEGNTIPSYDMCQNYRHLGPDKTGVKPKFVAVLGSEFYG
ncbi:MAG: sugar-transfer associated ATP-grasp domain-containing protein [Oscillospiraceae bacterium]|nr:sugar-transfer associated ATP-grasp domain-containing protein [Oscillospiraceae bacterium]